MTQWPPCRPAWGPLVEDGRPRKRGRGGFLSGGRGAGGAKRLLELSEDMVDVAVKADGPAADLLGAEGLAVVDTAVEGTGVLGGHLPEGIFDDDGGVMFIAHHF